MMGRLGVFIPCVLIICVSGVEIQNPRFEPKEKECWGTDNKLSISGSFETHYERLRARYTGCTFVHGNIEIFHLHRPGNSTFDLGFLSTIKVVTGYVLVGSVDTEVIPLTSLRLIRGDNPVDIHGGNYSLAVLLMDGLKELRLPALQEITKGNVLFFLNPQLCFVDTIDWSVIGEGRVVMDTDGFSTECEECHSRCADSDGVRRCWGTGRQMCQQLSSVRCHPSCHGKCFQKGEEGCCNEACAVGCYGNLDTECEMCKYFRYRRKCVPQCPDENTYSLAQKCIKF